MTQLSEYQWVITAMGWAIIHSLWQITIIGSLWLVLIATFRKINSETRYFLSVLTMLLIVIVSGMTFHSELQRRIPNEKKDYHSERQTPAAETGITFETNIASSKREEGNIPEIENTSLLTVKIQEWLNPTVLKYLVGIWCAGVLIFGFRFLFRWVGLRSLANRGTLLFEEKQLAIFRQLQDKMGIKRSIIFLQSALAAAPVTFGHFRPIVLLPIGMVTGFPPKQLEAIILHELAHIRRNDFLMNAIQVWLEILFFYHPLVWIISKRIRIIREELCDDEVIYFGKNKMIYAESLINVQKYFLHHKNQLMMNAGSNKSELSNRIHRFFQPQPSTKKGKRSIHSYLLGLLILIVIGSYAFSSFSFPTVSVAADKMNVLYIGVDNPITVAVAGITSDKVKVECTDLSLEDLGNGHYIAKATKPGETILKVTADGHAPTEVIFRVKRIPAPVAKINQSTGGVMDATQMQKVKRLDAILPFDFDATCVVEGFHMVWVPRFEDPVEVVNRSAVFNETFIGILQKIKPGDVLYFDEVMCKCGEDATSRPINSLVFKIK